MKLGGDVRVVVGMGGGVGSAESCPEVIPPSGRRNYTLFDLNQAPLRNIHTVP